MRVHFLEVVAEPGQTLESLKALQELKTLIEQEPVCVRADLLQNETSAEVLLLQLHLENPLSHLEARFSVVPGKRRHWVFKPLA